MDVHVVVPNTAWHASPERMVEVARAAESLGFAGIWVTDHILATAEMRDSYGRVFEAMTALAYLAAVTERVRLGTSVIVLPMRNAFVLAKQAATIDAMSAGRLTLGLGVGWSEAEFANVGADFHTRGRRTDEAIQLFRHLFSGSAEPFRGRFFAYEDGIFDPLPPQGERLPILIGGRSEAALMRAATLGDIWQSSAIGPAEFAPCALRVRELAGDRRVEVGARTSMSGTAAEMAARVEEWRAAGAEHLLLSFGQGDDLLPNLRSFAEKVLPGI